MRSRFEVELYLERIMALRSTMDSTIAFWIADTLQWVLEKEEKEGTE